jgi:hypothetical protein
MAPLPAQHGELAISAQGIAPEQRSACHHARPAASRPGRIQACHGTVELLHRADLDAHPLADQRQNPVPRLDLGGPGRRAAQRIHHHATRGKRPSRRCSALGSTTVIPSLLGDTASGLDWRAVTLRGFSSGSSATCTVKALTAPRRHTCTGTRLPGRVLPTRRGRSADISTARPSKLRTMSPCSKPAFSAGLAFSTKLTKAPPACPT